MLAIHRAVGGTIRWRAPRRADAAPTVQLLNASGGVEIAAGTAATLHALNTTLAQACAAGATEIKVADAANVTVGDEYLLGVNAMGQREFVKVKGVEVAQDTVQFQHPTLFGYQSANALVGTYISYVLAASTDARFEQHWRAIFSWNLAAVAQPPGIVRFDLVRHWIQHAPVTMSDLLLLAPKIRERIAASFDWTYAFDAALNEVLRDINVNLYAHSIVADDDWRDLVALKCLAVYIGGALGNVASVERGGAVGASTYRAYWEGRYRDRLAVLRSQLQADEDQDSALEAHERGAVGGELLRG